MVKGYSRGHLIIFENDQWVYADNGMPIDQERPCAKCGKTPTPEGYDACIGHMDGVISACCGHGVSAEIIVYEKYCIMPEMPYCPSCQFFYHDTSNCETREDADNAEWDCTCTKKDYDKCMAENPIYFSGCNYWNNGGTWQDGPIGTATAMHDCGDCPKIKYCLVKQAEPIFKIDKRQINRDWMMVLEYERNNIY